MSHTKYISTDTQTEIVVKAYSDIYYQQYKEKYGKSPKPPRWVFAHLAGWMKNDPPTLEEFADRMRNYFKAAWVEGHTLQNFLSTWDKWITSGRGAVGGTCQHFPDPNHRMEDRGDHLYGYCGGCGKMAKFKKRVEE